MKTIFYPKLTINMNHLKKNISEISNLCAKNNIAITTVIKGFNGITQVDKAFIDNNIKSIGSSRIEQLEKIKELNPSIETLLIRIPSISNLERIIKSADVSLNSEYDVVKKIDTLCKKLNIKHSVILMFDLGDLREGFFNENEFIMAAKNIENNLSNIYLKGIGTNLGCYGSIKPSIKNLTRLSSIAENIETIIGRKLEIISGGASTSLSMLKNNTMPKKINHLRIGEAILINRDLEEYWGYDFSNLYNDIFTLKAEIIEIKNKPSYPVGEIFIDAFGNRPTYTDIGIRKRAILNIGKQDFGDHTKLIPTNKNIKIIGSSSDHLIVDITDCKIDYNLGDIISFNLYYEAMLFLSRSEYVVKELI
ncbi:alanine/ornithine racemase family PLP-dependent enzyme [Helicovermis profundi]|uniref:Ornithine racemase Orr n=1 Tax=Helicovermis profundi TaxID=3065157 RepID=A0AAU9EAY3_9FIRM|nr:ornithine racemase Orr [Clostridia bacterium S502]